MKRGALIVFEGVDRCGKTTQTKKLVETLQQKAIESELLRFPERTTSTGKIIDSYLQNGVEIDDKAIHLLFSANRWEASRSMKEKLEKGITLIVDRYAYSGVCFTAAKPGQDIEWCKSPDVGLPEPDAVIFLDLPIEKAMRRGAFGEERYEKEDFQKIVYKNFQTLMTPEWHVVDASLSVEELATQIETVALQTIKDVKDFNKPIGNLWK